MCGTFIPLLNEVPVGKSVRVFIRPEHVRLQSDDQGHAQVEQATFLGAIERTAVSMDGMQLISQHAPTQRYQLGDRVRISIRPVPVMAEIVE